MIQSLGALVLNYNEAPMLRLTLPALRTCVDEIIVVDMMSTDESSEIFAKLLDGRDKIVRYPRENLFAYGFAHPRNFGCGFAQSEWLIAVDADELIDVAELQAWRSTYVDDEPVLHVPRREYQIDGKHGLNDLSALIETGSFTSQRHCRLFRNAPDIRWEGVIHEEIWNGNRTGWVEHASAAVTLHHLNAFKPAGDVVQKLKLYYYLTLKAATFPRMRFGTNDFWFDDYTVNHLEQMLGYAAAFTTENGLPLLSEEGVRRGLALAERRRAA